VSIIQLEDDLLLLGLTFLFSFFLFIIYSTSRKSTYLTIQLISRISLFWALSSLIIAFVLVYDLLIDAFVPLSYYDHMQFIVVLLSLALIVEFILTNILGSLIERMSSDKSDTILKERLDLYIRLIVSLFCILVVLEYFNISSVSILMIKGGAIFALGWGAKEIFTSFFSGFMIFIDRPFSLHDYIYIPKLNIKGKVTNLGLRVTEITSEGGFPVLVNNFNFSSYPVINLSRRDIITSVISIQISLDNANQIREKIKNIKQKMNDEKDFSASSVTLAGIKEYYFSLNFFIDCEIDNKLYMQENLRVKSMVNKKLIAIIKSEGLEFAYPSKLIIQSNSDQVK